MTPLERYESLIDDPEAFRDACDRPLPAVVRVNTIETTVDRASEALTAEGVAHEPTDWHPGVFRLEEASPGRNWPHAHGWIHGQEEVSNLPAVVLDPDPGDRVWDACAAPGSKTTQLAALMDDRGLLVGNDNNLGRLSALRHNAERLGVTNLVVTNRDARNFSLKPLGGGGAAVGDGEGSESPRADGSAVDSEERRSSGRRPEAVDSEDSESSRADGNAVNAFDRALVDAPCSCEGTIRKNPDAFDTWSLDHVHSVAGVQKGILRRAVQATRPGGTVVYSTCTFAPEENEAVLDHVLDAEDCRLVDFDAPLDGVPGVTEWQGTEYDPSVERALRIYPHHNDTGGFFCAKVEVTG